MADLHGDSCQECKGVMPEVCVFNNDPLPSASLRSTLASDERSQLQRRVAWLEEHYEAVMNERDAATARAERADAAEADLRQHILDIDAHATPYGDIPDEPGWVGTYLLTAGALHRALGKIGHTAPKCQAEAERDAFGDALEKLGDWQETVAARVPDEYKLGDETKAEYIDQWLDDMEAERDRLAGVRALHVRAEDNVAERLRFTAPDLCLADGETWPCPTVAALDAQRPAEGGPKGLAPGGPVDPGRLYLVDERDGEFRPAPPPSPEGEGAR